MNIKTHSIQDPLLQLLHNALPCNNRYIYIYICVCVCVCVRVYVCVCVTFCCMHY